MNSTALKHELVCYHCGLACADRPVHAGDHVFCCSGCRAVYEILSENGLHQYYAIESRPGTSLKDRVERPARFAFLDDDDVQQQLLDFNDGNSARVTLRLPQIHCASCVWLLENLHRLDDGVRRAEADFLRRELALEYDPRVICLRRVVELLASIGYEPDISLGSGDTKSATADPVVRRLGVAGFCFANTMLFSLPAYFAHGDLAGRWVGLFGLLNLALAIPVLLYSAAPFLNGARCSLAQRAITIDVPIAVGIITLFSRSLFEILAGAGPGYMDTFTGLVFFLLIGRFVQRNSFAALSFERDYRSYFPLAASVSTNGEESTVPVSALAPGHCLIVRHGELVPADSRLLSAHGRLDYSYVTGESAPVEAASGAPVWAGGRVAGGIIELEVVRPVSQSYLTRLWNQDLFRKDGGADLASLANRVSRLFTVAVLGVAAATALYWLFVDPSLAAHAATSVLIVACPCALALSTPFTTGTALNLLARSGLFLREGAVVERLARVGAIVLDKTGTLTSTTGEDVVFAGGAPLSAGEESSLRALLANSVHPLSRKVLAHLGPSPAPLPTGDYQEVPGLGLHGEVDGVSICVGSSQWLDRHGVDGSSPEVTAGTAVYVAFAGVRRGFFHLGNTWRPGAVAMLGRLRSRFDLFLLSGDNDRERPRLLPHFGEGRLHFSQSPEQKLHFVRDLEEERRVLMVGDGLNDAGALRQSTVGIAVSEDVAAFSPACDGILQASSLERLPSFLRFARLCLLIVAASFALSLLYNTVGLSFAVRGSLSPLLSAVLMPTSSISVIAFTAMATRWAARATGVSP